MLGKAIFLGSPGSGKSTHAAALKQELESRGITTVNFDDLPYLVRKFQQDTNASPLIVENEELIAYGSRFKRKVRRDSPSDDFDVLDTSVYDEVLQEMQADIVADPELENKFVIIQFARSENYMPIKNNFPYDFFIGAYWIYLQCEHDVALRRMEKRKEGGGHGAMNSLEEWQFKTSGEDIYTSERTFIDYIELNKKHTGENRFTVIPTHTFAPIWPIYFDDAYSLVRKKDVSLKEIKHNYLIPLANEIRKAIYLSGEFETKPHILRERQSYARGIETK